MEIFIIFYSINIFFDKDHLKNTHVSIILTVNYGFT